LARPSGAAAARDGSRVDPEPSTFWAPPGDIAAKDIHHGFGRPSVKAFDDVTCQYLRPKTGWGAHPGFEVSCGGIELRFKLGNEIYGGPFNSRIFDALGYHTIPIDRLDRLRLAYDRRVLTQFHSRRRLTMSARFLFLPLATHVITDSTSPFDHIDSAVTTDGRTLTAAQLQAGLLRGT